ncbi:Phosphomannomutase [Alkalibacterium putridalgicola]|uniref:Phosphomannomutase n=1 Tax=Alkalibacterium putridalgicola TaxID=426703 RepID=A0A1H7TA18_9LACT|nr:phosphomannomutase/phosphoglucomutase [Alkalibacterium putridalgicola]GEK89297.1 phosphomannomutase [Alkalibacterium putridalgicola]SEL81583.1 Phosphomannomutase [Alkalibacterium putridalgicola]
MTEIDLKTLQNGSDIRGFALDTEKQKKNLTEETIKRIANGLTAWWSENTDQPLTETTITIGHDSRLTGPTIKNWLIDVFTRLGMNVIDTQMATTPALFMSTQYDDFNSDIGIMITASHLPMEYNGLKFFTKNGGLEHEDIESILFLAEQEVKVTDAYVSQPTEKDLLSVYAADLVAKIREALNVDEDAKPLSDRKIIVDAGNGAGGFFADKVLKVLGADTTGSQFLNPDGTFPNHEPNPDNKEAMQSISDAVLKNKADLGIIFDTDVDRSAIVDSEGNSINRNNLIGLIGAIILEENPGTTIVTNSPVSDHLIQFVEEMGGKVDRYISGYRNVINRGIDLNKEGIDCALAIETSGHAALRENFFLDDGAYLAAKIVAKEAELAENGKSVTDLIKHLDQPAETEEVRFVITDPDYKELGMDLLESFADWVNNIEGFTLVPDNLEGKRVQLSDPYGRGWLLLRMSLHEPKLVLQIENDQAGTIPAIKDKLKSFFHYEKHLDNSKL